MFSHPVQTFMIASRKIAAASEILRLSQSINLFLLSRAILFMSSPFSSSSCFRWCVCNFRGCQKCTKRPTLTFKKIQLDSLSEHIFSTYQGSMFTSMLLSRWFCSPSSTWQWLVLLPGRGLLLQPQCQGLTFMIIARAAPCIGERTIKVPFGVHLCWSFGIFHPIIWWRMRKRAVFSVSNGTSKTGKNRIFGVFEQLNQFRSNFAVAKQIVFSSFFFRSEILFGQNVHQTEPNIRRYMDETTIKYCILTLTSSL